MIAKNAHKTTDAGKFWCKKTLKSYHLKNANMFITDNLSCGDLEYKQRFLGKFSIWRNPIGKQKNKKC